MPGSWIHGTFQARILEWVAMSSYRESSIGLPFPTPGDLSTQGSNLHLSHILTGGFFFTTSATWEALGWSQSP